MVVLNAALLGCSIEPPELTVAVPVSPECPPQASADHYLPEGTTAASSSADRYWREWHTRYFEAAGVEPLWCGDGPEHAYRFLRSPSYRPAYIIDVRQRDDGWHVRAMVFEDPREQGKRPPVTTIVRTTERMISVEERQALLAALEEASFWSTRAWSAERGVDGETWLIEGRSRNRYRVVTRWGPTPEDAAFWRARVLFFKLAQLPVPAEAHER